jgi:hypothetical protein
MSAITRLAEPGCTGRPRCASSLNIGRARVRFGASTFERQWVRLTAYPVDSGGLWWSNRPPGTAGLISKTTPVDSGGRSTVSMAFRRSGVRIPSGPSNF